MVIGDAGRRCTKANTARRLMRDTRPGESEDSQRKAETRGLANMLPNGLRPRQGQRRYKRLRQARSIVVLGVAVSVVVNV